ncbi:glucokinase [Methylobacillus rhizosphaerae]|uniref:Glucokinase n=1 Tax=Methylobacillus rhizosphaerae TaxID=551994 RepID=A0A238ZLY9_9PROT|nr:ROK family protein [Methylobacillus rhizosphaerae]SNR84081.1 glucokinase [Methylobacillus rhizosphaerae]
MAALNIGVDIGGTNLRVGVVRELEVIYQQRFPADFSAICKQHAPEAALQEILRITSAALLQAKAAYPDVQHVGIGFPGFIDPKSGQVLQSPNLPGLRKVDLAAALSRLIELPVRLENDALVAALGEYKLLETPPRSMVYIGLGTGVGGGLIHAGLPYPGDHGIAMEIGHLIVEANGRQCGCGNKGCLEQYAAAPGVIASYAELSGQHLVAHDIAARADADDEAALAAYALAGRYLGQAIAHIVKTVDPELVLVGGGMSQAWRHIAPELETQLDNDLVPVLRNKITMAVSESGDLAGIIGAAYLS